MDVPVKSGDSNSKDYRDIQQRSRRMQHFRPFLNFDNFRPEEYREVISIVVTEPTGVKVSVKFVDTRSNRSNRSRDIRLPNFVCEQRRRPTI